MIFRIARILIFLLSFNNLFAFFPSNNLNRPIKKNYIKASLNGIEMGLITVGAGLLMDNTISNNSLIELKETNKTLFNEGMVRSYRNLLFLGPSYYYFNENNLKDLNYDVNSITPQFAECIIETILVVFIHSIGYYLTHKLMHRNDHFKKYHYFHHQFNETLIPSIGNAVSEVEFSFAYMFPFVVSAFLINPYKISFNVGIMIVSIMNLVIHCPELKDIKWNNYFVSPLIHLNHHQSKNKKSAFSAPTFNIEYLLEKLNKFSM